MRAVSGAVITTIFGAITLAPALVLSQADVFNPHGDKTTGVLRVAATPSTRGECVQCHPFHDRDDSFLAPAEKILFTENDNRLPFWDQGDGPCHRGRPQNYPLEESDRIPEGLADAGYFDANTGGVRRPGVEWRGRWPGETVWSDLGSTAEGRFYSPHAQDPDMPRRGPDGEGLCLNCHDPHGTANPFDMLAARYEGIAGHGAAGPPPEYELCLSCHSVDGPAGMNASGRQIADYYDAGLNGESAGHQIRMNGDVALSWPSHLQAGDMLPCYDCHNPHGSEGSNGVEPNAFLLSDQRAEWHGLTDPRGDAAQGRRFCLGCHIESDGVPGSKQVEGIVMNAIPDEEGHQSTSTRNCFSCHGADYSGPTSNNVHNVHD